jgi:hypothetical protein
LATPGVISPPETEGLRNLKSSLEKKPDILYVFCTLETYPAERASLNNLRFNHCLVTELPRLIIAESNNAVQPQAT